MKEAGCRNKFVLSLLAIFYFKCLKLFCLLIDHVCYQAAGRVGHVIDTAVVLLVVGADDAVVDDQRAVEIGRQEAPYDEHALY